MENGYVVNLWYERTFLIQVNGIADEGFGRCFIFVKLFLNTA